MSADTIALGMSAFACAVFIGLLLAELAREFLTDRRTRSYEAGRAAAVAERRDADWRALKAEWLGPDFDTAPVLNHDPEVLGS